MTRIERMADRNAVLCSLYANGATLTDIAAQFGITRQRVQQIVRRAGEERGVDVGRVMRMMKDERAVSWRSLASLCGKGGKSGEREVRQCCLKMGKMLEAERLFVLHTGVKRKKASDRLRLSDSELESRRERLLATIRAIGGSTGRSPTTLEVQHALGLGENTGRLYTWAKMPLWKAWRECGYERRLLGGPGHVDYRTGRKVS